MDQINRFLSRIKRSREPPGGDFSGYLIEKREVIKVDSLMLSKGMIIDNEYKGGDTNDNETGTGSSVRTFKAIFSEWQQ